MAKYLDEGGIKKLVELIKSKCDGKYNTIIPANTYAPYNHIHSAYVNQNAFSKVTVGTTTIEADTPTDTLTLVAGSNISLTPDATNDKITIATTGLITPGEVDTKISNALTSTFTYKGTITAASTTGPANHKVGDVYIVKITSGTINVAGHTCEKGDMLVCNTTGTTANASHWDVVQGNWSATDGVADLAWGQTVTLATIGGVSIDAKLPSNPNVNSSHAHGVGTGLSKTGNDGTSGGTVTYSLKTAATGEIGGIKASNVLSSAVTLTSSNGATSNRYYGVQVDNGGQAFVNVPWESNTHYTSKNVVGTSNTATSDGQVTGTGGVYLNHIENGSKTSSHKIVGSGAIKVTSDTSGNITIGGIATGYTTNNASRNYAVQLNGSNQAYVNVPWENSVDFTKDERLSEDEIESAFNTAWT